MRDVASRPSVKTGVTVPGYHGGRDFVLVWLDSWVKS